MPKKDGTIGVAERKEIRNFTDLEYQNLRGQVRAEASRVESEREAAIREGEKAKLAKHLKSVERLKQKAIALNNEIRDFIVAAKEEGITQKGSGRYGDDPVRFVKIEVSYGDNWTTAATEKEVKDMKALVQRELDNALREIDLKRTEAERNLLISAFEGDAAKDLLASIPRAADVFTLNGAPKAKELSK